MNKLPTERNDLVLRLLAMRIKEGRFYHVFLFGQYWQSFYSSDVARSCIKAFGRSGKVLHLCAGQY